MRVIAHVTLHGDCDDARDLHPLMEAVSRAIGSQPGVKEASVSFQVKASGLRRRVFERAWTRTYEESR